MKKTIIVILLALLLVGGGVLGTLFLTGAFSHQASAKTDAVTETPPPANHDGPPIYVNLEPAFTVTFGDTEKAQFLQIQLNVTTRDPEIEKTIQTNMPAVRNGLVMLFSSQKPDDLQTREGKERLREQALKEIQHIVEGYTGKPGVEEVFFTSFLMQ